MSLRTPNVGESVKGERGPAAMVLQGLLGLAIILAASLGMWRLDVRAATGLPLGAHDFVAYWSAYDVAESGGNPYDDTELQEAQTRLNDRYRNGAQRYWSPPWSLLLLLPVLSLPFAVASATWFVLQLTAGLALIALSWRLFRPDDRAPPPIVFGLSAVFVPLFEGLRIGQVGVLVAGMVLCGLLALRHRHDTLAGVLLASTIFKPQAVVLVLVVVGVHLLATRRWRVIGSAVATAATLVAASRLILPSVWAGWDPLGGSPTHWKTATLASQIRELLPVGGDWPLALVPTVAILVTFTWAIANRDRLRWDRLPLILALSVLLAPYAWVPDAMLALPVHVLAIGALVERRGRWGAAAGLLTIGAQVAALILLANGASYDQFILIPLALVVAALLTSEPAPDRASGPASPLATNNRPGLPAGNEPAAPFDLSIVIPAYQEEHRIPVFLDALVAYVADSDRSIEVLVVDDGSKDNLATVIERYATAFPTLRCITLPENRGKGFAVRTGMLAATGRRRAFIDADGSIHPSQIDRLLAVEANVVISSVAAPGAELDPPQGPLRAAAGSLGNRLIRTLVLPGVLDSQRGCKVFRDVVADVVFAECEVDRWAFDVEALALARKFGHEPVEVGIRWSHRDGGTIRPTTYLETLRIVFTISRRLGRQPEVRQPSAIRTGGSPKPTPSVAASAQRPTAKMRAGSTTGPTSSRSH